MEAAERYDPKRVDRFEAFAEYRIRGAMLDDLRARDTLSRDMRRLSNELREATRRWSRSWAAAPTRTSWPRPWASTSTSCTPASRSCPAPRWWASTTPAPTSWSGPATTAAPTPSRSTAHRETLARLVDGIDDLPEKMQQVLSLYYCENLNLKEIGEVLGVTESRVCQIHGEATRRLRETLGELDETVAA